MARSGKSERSVNPDHTFDIETEGWDKYVLGATFSPGNVRRYTWRNEIDHARDLLSLSGNVYAHNGGRFDFLWLIRTVIEHDLLPAGTTLHPIESGSSIIMLRVKGPQTDLIFRDSYAMFPLPLRKLGVKDDTGLDCLYLHDE